MIALTRAKIWWLQILLPIVTATMLFVSGSANAVPSFARQTGQNCVACHAGGQFPELTPYGRKFKLTGYTIGESANPLSMMAVASANKTASTSDPNGNPATDFPKDGVPVFSTASIFLAGKLADKLGAFVQVTYNNYDHQSINDSHWAGHTTSDNLDVRYADRFVDADSDLIVGATLNNNPTVQDVWNSAPAWGFNTVPGSTGPGPAPLLAGGLAQQAAGLGAYAYWNDTVYGELSFYRTANGIWSFMSQGFNTDLGSQQIIKGYSPYLRFALTHNWGASNGMIGLFGMTSDLYPDPTDPSGATSRYRDVGIDGQYQYILDPHTVTAQFSYIKEKINWADQGGANPLGAGNPSDTLDSFRAKASYVYQAKYGGSLSLFHVNGSSDSMYQTTTLLNDPASPSVSGSLSTNPGTAGWTSEVFWIPIQNARIGLQYTAFTKFNGGSANYDGWGRNAKDNNTTFLYLWAAY